MARVTKTYSRKIRLNDKPAAGRIIKPKQLPEDTPSVPDKKPVPSFADRLRDSGIPSDLIRTYTIQANQIQVRNIPHGGELSAERIPTLADTTFTTEISVPRLTGEAMERLNEAVRQAASPISGLVETSRVVGERLSRAFGRSPESIRPSTLEQAARMILVEKNGNGASYQYQGIPLRDFPTIRLTEIDDSDYDDSRRVFNRLLEQVYEINAVRDMAYRGQQANLFRASDMFMQIEVQEMNVHVFSCRFRNDLISTVQEFVNELSNTPNPFFLHRSRRARAFASFLSETGTFVFR